MHWTPDCTRLYHPQTSVNSGASIAASAQRARADERYCYCEGPQMKSKIRKQWHLIGSMLVLALLAAVNRWAWAAGPQTRGPERIEHIVIIYLENRSFDNLYGHFPGANGLQDASKTATQTDAQGQVYATFPPVMSDRAKPLSPTSAFPRTYPTRRFL